MRIKTFSKTILICFAMVAISSFTDVKTQASTIKEISITYKVGDFAFIGYITYDESIKGKRPAVLVVHEWWGLNDYSKMRARMLAELGYIAMAVDLYGDGKLAVNPKEAQDLTMPFYRDPLMAKIRLDGAIRKIKEFSQTDPDNIAAIGYCFGGYIVLNAAKLGSDLKGVVSFHGGLGGAPFDKKLLKAKILACQGENDKFVTMHDADMFKHKLDSIGAVYTFKSYPNATHAFTNPDATKTGKEFNLPIEYNQAADKDSWNDMKTFFAGIFEKSNNVTK
jgi:dienelactone hydrolase